MSYKSSEGRETGKLTNVFRSVKTVLGQNFGGAGATAPSFAIISASGGTVSNVSAPDGNTYRTHSFTSPGTFTVSSAEPGAYVDLEIIGTGAPGGGGFGDGNPGGGGGGSGAFGIVQRFPVKASPGTYTITIGGNTPAYSPPGGNVTFSGASGEAGGETITITAGGGDGNGNGSRGPGSSMGILSKTDPAGRIRLGNSCGGPGNPAPAGGGGGSAYSGYPSDAFLYPTPFQASGYGNGAGGQPGPGGPIPVGNPGAVRVYYRVS
jgi:hypothetical protein